VFGDYKFRILLVEILHLFLIVLEFEESVLFGDQVGFREMIGADKIPVLENQILFRFECFASYTIIPFVFAFVDISLVIRLLKHLLYEFFMVFLCRSDKVRIGNL